MPEYIVMWEIEITAEGPRQAATAARRYQRDPRSVVGVFDVRENREGAEIERIHLDEDDDDEGSATAE